MYKSKSSFLFFSVVLFAAAAQLQWGGVRWEGLKWDFRVESYAAVASLDDDLRFVRHEMKMAPERFRTAWIDLRSSMLSLEADAAVESQLAVPGTQNR